MSMKQFRYHIPEKDRLGIAERILVYRKKIKGGCWIWTGFVQPNGYGWTTYKRVVSMGAHRMSYLIFVGDIPARMHVHHKCKNKACFNPRHLKIVTAREHMRLDNMPGYRNSIKTHCIRGHEFSKENTQYKTGKRICRACRRIFNNELYARLYSSKANGGICKATMKKYESA